MNMWRPVKARELTPEAAADVRRIEALWTDCRTRFGGERHHSCSAPSGRSTPCTRRWSRGLHTYAIEVAPVARDYMAAIMALPAWQEWRQAALAEPWVLANGEVDWPTVLRVQA